MISFEYKSQRSKKYTFVCVHICTKRYWKDTQETNLSGFLSGLQNKVVRAE